MLRSSLRGQGHSQVQGAWTAWHSMSQHSTAQRTCRKVAGHAAVPLGRKEVWAASEACGNLAGHAAGACKNATAVQYTFFLQREEPSDQSHQSPTPPHPTPLFPSLFPTICHLPLSDAGASLASREAFGQHRHAFSTGTPSTWKASIKRGSIAQRAQAHLL